MSDYFAKPSDTAANPLEVPTADTTPMEPEGTQPAIDPVAITDSTGAQTNLNGSDAAPVRRTRCATQEARDCIGLE